MTAHLPAEDAGVDPTRSKLNSTWTLERIRDLGAVTTVPIAATIFGLSRSGAYDLIRAQRFPVPVLLVGNRYRVPVHAILTALHVPEDLPGPDDPPADLTDPGSDASMEHTKSPALALQQPPDPTRSTTP